MPMTGKERMLAALSGGTPDRVPAAPDMSNMIPARLTGRPFWDVYYHANPSLELAYARAVAHFGCDGWLTDGGVHFHPRVRLTATKTVLSQTPEALVVRRTLHTPDGDISEVVHYSAGNPPTSTEKFIKDFREDFPKIRHLYPGFDGYDTDRLPELQAVYGQRGINSGTVVPPGFHTLMGLFNGNLEECTYAYYDEHDLFLELAHLMMAHELQKLDLILDGPQDAVLISSSGSVTLQNPDIWDELTLPFIQEATRRCRQAGKVCGIHSCGKSQHLLRRCATETQLDYVNPLEIPPMGDVTLAGVRAEYGSRFALMGNLHTTETMLMGSVDDVRLESLCAIREAGADGGFVLSTGDQCGRDTPDGNIRAMVETAQEFGQYPLNMERIGEEIARLEKAGARRAPGATAG